ncbi:hypothetical protein F511_36980 [Dorcoceras hygrometricum]|uniref:Uncharacterized protein n=1 Tax=Dorcoceras hygrometricum TaxID=472368 RepID=A0A2Z7AE20_9LAMI|nr:hypothetical protein F511_36980 [Dorcoceras hygrometricum]
MIYTLTLNLKLSAAPLPFSQAAAAAAVLATPPPPPPLAGICSGQLFEENPSALISSGLLVQADEGVSLPVMDLIDESTAAYREEPFALVLIVLNVSRPNFILPLPPRETGSGSATVPQQWYQSVRLVSIDTITAILYLIFNFLDRKTKFGKQAAGRRHVRRRPPRCARVTPSRAGRAMGIFTSPAGRAIGARWPAAGKRWSRDFHLLVVSPVCKSLHAGRGCAPCTAHDGAWERRARFVGGDRRPWTLR